MYERQDSFIYITNIIIYYLSTLQACSFPSAMNANVHGHAWTCMLCNSSTWELVHACREYHDCGVGFILLRLFIKGTLSLEQIRTKRLELLRNYFHSCLRGDCLPISTCSFLTHIMGMSMNEISRMNDNDNVVTWMLPHSCPCYEHVHIHILNAVVALMYAREILSKGRLKIRM